MNGKEKRIRILDIQGKHCQPCEFQMKPLQECMRHCEVGLELKELARDYSKRIRGENLKKNGMRFVDKCQVI